MAGQVHKASKNYLRLTISLAIFVLALAYPVYKFFAVQALFPEYQAFPLVIVAISAILYFRLKEAVPNADAVSATRRKYCIRVIIALSVLLSLLLLLAIGIRSFRLSVIVLVGFLGVVTLASTLSYRIPGIWQVWALSFLLTIRLPRTFVADLQLWSSWLSSQMLEVFGLLHVMRGNTLLLPDKELFVDEACSGIVSLITIISAVALYCVWMRRSFVHICLMILLGGLWTVLMNAVRIVSIAVALGWWSIDLSEGIPHTVLGMLLFLISLGALKLIDLLLFEIFRPIDPAIAREGRQGNAGYLLMKFWDRWVVNSAPSQAELDLAYAGYGDRLEVRSSARETKKQFEKQRNDEASKPLRQAAWDAWLMSFDYLFNWPVLAILICVLGWQTYGISDENSTLALMDITKSRVELLTKDINPLKRMNFEVVSFEVVERNRNDILGEQSRVWGLRTSDGKELFLSVDFPFGPEWHELSVCYRGAGWTVSDYAIRETELGTERWTSSAFTITSGDKQSRVYFTGFGANGKPIGRNPLLFNLGINRNLGDVGYYYQIQILTDLAVDQYSGAKADALLEEAAKYIRDTLCASNNSVRNLTQK